jgi:hypothetical protein
LFGVVSGYGVHETETRAQGQAVRRRDKRRRRRRFEYSSEQEFAKAVTAKRAREMKREDEQAQIESVRSYVERRDLGVCRLRFIDALCAGPVDWAHLETHRRSRTSYRPPEERHTIEATLLLCRYHHRRYDLEDLTLEVVDAKRGTSGPLRVHYVGVWATGADVPAQGVIT